MTACRKPAGVVRFVKTAFFALLFFAAPPWPELPAIGAVSDYQPVFKAFYDESRTLRVAIRSFRRGGEDFFLVLDPYRFSLTETASATVLSSPATGDAPLWGTPFYGALQRLTSPPYHLQNDGLRHSEHPVPGYFLTADLCPAKKPLDRRFVEAMGTLPQKSPIPVALMVSGLWIQRHESDLAWLREKESSGMLSITWVNHSFTHAFDPSAPLERNFLLTPKTDFLHEVLALERLLIEQGIAPSPFFRFPGLVSSRRLVEELRNLSLIPIGSDAWLAKGETAKPGSVVLVHGNGNEPEGIRLLLSLWEGQREAFARGQTTLLPLREAFFPR